MSAARSASSIRSRLRASACSRTFPCGLFRGGHDAGHASARRAERVGVGLVVLLRLAVLVLAVVVLVFVHRSHRNPRASGRFPACPEFAVSDRARLGLALSAWWQKTWEICPCGQSACRGRSPHGLPARPKADRDPALPRRAEPRRDRPAGGVRRRPAGDRGERSPRPRLCGPHDRPLQPSRADLERPGDHAPRRPCAKAGESDRHADRPRRRRPRAGLARRGAARLAAPAPARPAVAPPRSAPERSCWPPPACSTGGA